MIVYFDANDSLSRKCLSVNTADQRENSSETADKPLKTISDYMNQTDMSVKVDISKEGLIKYKEMCQNNRQDEDFKGLNIVFTPEGMVFGNKDWPDINDFIDVGKSSPEKMLMKRIKKWTDDWTSVKEKASMLLNAYARAYDEIVKGYQDGTRVKYITDVDTYRTVTMKEELEALKKQYEGKASALEEMHRLSCRCRASIARRDAEWAERDFLITKEEAEVTVAKYLKLKNEEKIVNVTQKLLDAGAIFASQYDEYGLSRLNLEIL